ncbi:MAG: hypothetical protein SFU98_07425 [Leptospiraceae bacterium]|nr:hypothetical protein [Leptospiraceae bacterium]
MILSPYSVVYILQNMASKTTRFGIAKKDIESFFEGFGTSVFFKKDLGRILEEKRGFWRLPQSMSVSTFIRDLEEKSFLKSVTLKFPHRSYHLYTWKEISLYSLLQNAFPRHHFSHHTAAYFHGLTEQIPKNIYFRTELSRNPENESPENQELIDRVFKGKVRESNTFCLVNEFRIYSLFSKKLDDLGIIEMNLTDGSNIRLTDIERTLIDITVRPIYAGGLHEVLKIYQNSASIVSVNKLIAYLRKMNFTYPYHQSIGFLMQLAGNFSPTKIEQLKEIPMNMNFYLDYAMKEMEYSPEWKLYYPKFFKP